MSKNKKIETSHPLISFLVISFNQLNLLKASIQSIENQTAEFPYEIIVIDTGSSKKIKEWISNQKNILSIFAHHRKHSLGESISLGITAAQGKYTCLMGNGAILYPDVIKTTMDTFFSHQSSKSPDAIAWITNEKKHHREFGYYFISEVDVPVLTFGLVSTKILKNIDLKSFSSTFFDLSLTLSLFDLDKKIEMAYNSFVVTDYPIIINSYRIWNWINEGKSDLEQKITWINAQHKPKMERPNPIIPFLNLDRFSYITKRMTYGISRRKLR